MLVGTLAVGDGAVRGGAALFDSGGLSLTGTRVSARLRSVVDYMIEIEDLGTANAPHSTPLRGSSCFNVSPVA